MSSSKQRLPGRRAKYSENIKHISNESTNTEDDTAKPTIKKQLSRSVSRSKVDSGLLGRKTKENKGNSMSSKDPKSSPPPTKPRIQSSKPQEPNV